MILGMRWQEGELSVEGEWRGPSARDIERLRQGGFAIVEQSPEEKYARDLDRVLSGGLAAGVFPGAVALVTKGRSILYFRAFGKRVVGPESDRTSSDAEPMTCDTIFDMASLTKPLLTTTLVLQLADEGALRLSDTVKAHFSEFARSPFGGATVEQLLTHTAGFPGWRPVYLYAHGRDEVISSMAKMEAVAEPGKEFVYSDLGFMLLGLLVERLTGKTLDTAAEERLFGPLAMKDSSIGHGVDVGRVAPTENGNLYEQGMIGPAARDFERWREGIIRNSVHDGNAFYALDGVAGHAGLFSSAVDVALLLRSLINGGVARYIETVATNRTVYVPGIHRGLGWGLNRGFNALFGPSLGQGAFGHTGFTGTSVVVDPGVDGRRAGDPGNVAIYVLLSNRVHPSAHNCDIITFRARFHEFASKLVEQM